MLWPLLLSCAAERPASQPAFAETNRSSPLQFRYELVDGKGWLASEMLRGRPTVLAFLTTYDLGSQAEARFLAGVAKRHVPRINAAAIVLETPQNRPLMVAFRDALRLDYPVAIGDSGLIRGEGPFGDVHVVPSVVVLDAESRLVRKHFGLAKEDDIEDALRGL
ncbi:MAG TPA: TlpA family protein disulfide reductase [Polyangiaceae bacterium]|nr:TlpA family protein disulfide reductase [Polyangiaceae bacterium]